MNRVPGMLDMNKKQSPATSAGLTENPKAKDKNQTEEIGGREGPEPTRYGDWEVGGRCTDF
ncbi:MAG: DUF1674 domain-containing protein [Rhodospirillaceae bacterium]|nr:DUF1674 domain-containing protein [Rhodospirillaceae bacterium]